MSLEIFYSYAHADEALRQHLETHLSLLLRQGLISEWHDRQILAGDEWARDIDQHLETASIILLLISPDFLASNYCYDIEMERALERHKRGEARVIPIIVRPVDWHSAPFGKLQCLPRDGKPVTEWDNQDAAFRDIAQGIRRAIEQRPSAPLPVPRLSPLDRQNRMRLLKRVRATWIEGVLEHSLHQAALIALDLQEQPDALANPWQLEVQETNLPPRPLPAGTSIVQVYDEADGELLILGEPGAGKTTLLLELARTLLDRAEADEHHRIPVVFNLSSWAEKRPPLSEWLVEELWTKYQVPHKIGQSWMASDQLLPLLDGLDEVAEEARSGCVQTINTYYQQSAEQGPTLLVICCRNQEYTGLQTRVLLHHAVSIQPLTDDQIERCLQSANGQLEGLRHALQDDPELYELARRPLMLNIFMLAYQGATPEDLPTEGTREAQQRQVFATYVERMLLRRSAQSHYSQEHIQHWLAWLARQMQQRHMTEFYLEQLQPTWLPTKRLQQICTLLFRLVAGFSGLAVGLGLGSLFSQSTRLLAELGFGLGFGLFLGLRRGLQKIRPILPMRQFMKEYLRHQGTYRIEVPTWSWKSFWPLLLAGLFLGLLAGLEEEPFQRIGVLGWLISIPFLGLGFGLCMVLSAWLARRRTLARIGRLNRELSNSQINKDQRRKPNQNIRLSGWSALRSLGTGLLFGLVFGLFLWLTAGLGPGLLFGVFFGLAFGLGFGLSQGGLAYLQHYILRFLLLRTGAMPWHYVRFLDYAVERMLLREVGGGYIFIHRLLLDYFASLEKKEP